LGLSKSVWYGRQQGIWRERKAADLRMKEWILSVIEDHPGYGYRRICPELSERLGAPVNHKRVRRVLRCYELGLPRCLPASTPSRVQRVIAEAGSSADLTKGRRFAPMEASSTDFTELVYAGGERKAWLMALVDIASRWAGGWSVASRRNRETALDALGHLRRSMGDRDLSLEGVVIHHDRDSCSATIRTPGRRQLEFPILTRRLDGDSRTRSILRGGPGGGYRRAGEEADGRAEQAREEGAGGNASGMDPNTARQYRREGKLPSEKRRPRTWRTRDDRFAEVWDEVAARLDARLLVEPRATRRASSP
jgi:hypothetical protein